MSWHEAAASPHSKSAAGSCSEGQVPRMDRRKQWFQKRTAVTKEEFPAPQAKSKQPQQQIFLSALGCSDDKPHSSPVQHKSQHRSSAALRDRGASEQRRARCASLFRRLSASFQLPPNLFKTAKYAPWPLRAQRFQNAQRTPRILVPSPIRNTPCLRV